MLWYIAIVATLTLILAIAIYRRPAESNEAAILEAAAQIGALSERLTGTGTKIQQSTETVKNIENPGGTSP